MSEASLRAWVELDGSFTPAPAPAVVEIGAGTGMFCAALARWRQASLVVGVDPA
jgi:tRNA G46 methylase TrmB